MALQPEDLEPHLRAVLEPDERVHAAARATEAALLVSDRRLIVASSERLHLSVPLEAIRRIEFDIERNRPATLVIVPESPHDEVQVLAIPREQYQAAAAALVAIGMLIYDRDTDPR